MAARSSPVIACARMSCQIGALDKREVHSIGGRLTSIRISGSMFSPEQIIKLYGCIPMRFLLREALNKDCLCTGFHAALACSFQRSLFAGLTGLAPLRAPQSACREDEGEHPSHAERVKRQDEQEGWTWRSGREKRLPLPSRG